MDPQLFCLRWNNHQSNLLSVFDHLLQVGNIKFIDKVIKSVIKYPPTPFTSQVEAFCDVTLAVDGASLKCHKMVLAACSTYFQNLFMENTCKHPIVFLKVESRHLTEVGDCNLLVAGHHIPPDPGAAGLHVPRRGVRAGGGAARAAQDR